jgi:hypothetical protein
MLIPLLIVAWLAVMVLCVTVCQVAARGDAALVRIDDQVPHPLHAPELMLTDERFTSPDVGSRAARSAAGS